MEVRFERQELPYLEKVLGEARNQELSQEIRLPEGMPDVGRVLCAWGQPVLRGKEWNGGTASASGGMQVWILYGPEDGSPEQCMEGWIPFQVRWDLPGEVPEGAMAVRCLCRFVDARSVTPRKLMVRTGLGLLAEAWSPAGAETAVPGEENGELELKREVWPLRMEVEAGEKAFALEEELALPASAPVPEKLLLCRMDPKIREARVVGERLAFRGSGNLHLLYRSREGQVHGWDFEMPFSQLAELDRTYGQDARAEVVPAVTALEPELTEAGSIRLRCGIAGQYRVNDRRMVTVAADAYSPGRELELQRQTLELPTVLEERMETLHGEQELEAGADIIADTAFLPDIPRIKRTGSGLEMRLPGQFQVLWYGPEGELQGSTVRWEGKLDLPAGEDVLLWAVPEPGELPRAMSGGGKISLSCSQPMRLTLHTRQRISTVTGLTVGERREADPQRPSLILRRAGEQDLWDLAKAAGTTVEAIRRANGLTEEPAPGRMLLIPVP